MKRKEKADKKRTNRKNRVREGSKMIRIKMKWKKGGAENSVQ